LAFLALAIAAGAAFPIQAGLNARLATWVGGPIRASLISLLDHFGVLYREHGLSTGRIAGVIMLGAGVALVRFF
jgi:uncharacterized membrane protein YdcZ (DUF606 family)